MKGVLHTQRTQGSVTNEPLLDLSLLGFPPKRVPAARWAFACEWPFHVPRSAAVSLCVSSRGYFCCGPTRLPTLPGGAVLSAVVLRQASCTVVVCR